MSSGSMPSYIYRPTRNGEPLLKTYSSLRARLFIGGTYFRVREPGREGNRISVQVVEYDGGASASCVVTNYNLKSEEMVIGPVTVMSLTNRMKFDQFSIIDNLTSIPRARNYSIRAQIGATPTLLDSTNVSLNGVISLQDASLSVTSAQPYTAGSTIRVQPRIRIYPLTWVTIEVPPDPAAPPPAEGAPPPEPVTVSGWDIPSLRAQVNAMDPWIEMLEREYDLQDVPLPAKDALVLTSFGESYLMGGDGLPVHPDAEETGPTRSLMHVNYAEAHNGALSEFNTVYEWAGIDSRVGGWVKY